VRLASRTFMLRAQKMTCPRGHTVRGGLATWHGQRA
jgi:hypothetical protein